MAVIHHTTLTPGKLELLEGWLPSRPWYPGTGHPPELTKAGGFRLDDPDGEVGIEFMVVTDQSGREPASYHVPMTYRGAPLAGADDALIGRADHGVLGSRWLYDGSRDPVLIRQLVALLGGAAQAQAQSVSDTPDLSIVIHAGGASRPASTAPVSVADRPDGTAITFASGLVMRIIRRPEPGEPGEPHELEVAAASPQPASYVAGSWLTADGVTVRGLLVTAHAGRADSGRDDL